MMNITNQTIPNILRFNHTLFEGILIPETIRDTLNSITVEITDSNNIPNHIKEVQRHLLRNPNLSDEDIITFCNQQWFVEQIKIQIDRKEKNFNLKLDVFNNIFKICIDNFTIYRTLTSFVNIAKRKIEEVFKNVQDRENHQVTFNARTLDQLHTLHNL